ncbi:Phospholipase A2 domain,Phospholipase A2, histidine active site [Cinara cedri]|uniref:phospholipase A2 n=1 Tax=Cinara cedri TaxID=506608 RepID=A0A5E4NGY2_9HEMI|nr:Phospholipase A2 domain,Phospholipase A2, histidine active site [Cinara cedri]
MLSSRGNHCSSSWSRWCWWTVYLAVTVGTVHAKSPTKTYTGYKLNPKSLRMIYYYDQTIAIVEVGDAKALLNCELVEIYNDDEGKEMLKNLTKINKPLRITLDQMMRLMGQCDLLDPSQVDANEVRLRTLGASDNQTDSNGDRKTTASSLYSGILPGTKWCGSGDLATSFFDLGPEIKLDKCCRTHDLCPSKVRSFSTRYNITNNSMYTKSHCMCDQTFYNCLKKAKHPTGDIMGSIYFNLLTVPCVEEYNGKTIFKVPPRY